MVEFIAKRSDNLLVVGAVAGAICGLSKGLYDRKHNFGVSGITRTYKKETSAEIADRVDDMMDPDAIEVEVIEEDEED